MFRDVARAYLFVVGLLFSGSDLRLTPLQLHHSPRTVCGDIWGYGSVDSFRVEHHGAVQPHVVLTRLWSIWLHSSGTWSVSLNLSDPVPMYSS